MLPNTSLPGNPTEAGPRDPREADPTDWRDLLMFAEEELRFVRHRSTDSPAFDRDRRLNAIAAAKLLLDQAAKELQ